MTGSVDAGIALVETSRVLVTDNVLTDNKWGARYTVGASDNQARAMGSDWINRFRRRFVLFCP